ncbi:DUF3574 domain-containing protein [Streptomyces sp. NBC_01013]|uniref:DUF3574 domain-containing protein n=1 Tax=Streptomyces sp. NBC_01013 TaxID=2903718 RepID=UPI00386D878C|nr:DUF3574 domain-containing protein [Streptomyces sp. NBC_01013]
MSRLPRFTGARNPSAPPSTRSAEAGHRPRRRAALAAATAGLALLAVGTPVVYATLGTDSTAAAAPAAVAVTRGRDYVETRLFFGTERPDGGPDVTDQQFLGFIDTEVTPRFPNGLTIQDGRGQWRDSHGVIERERSYELTLLYPASEARIRDPQIERIRNAYEKAYAQDSVARLEERTTADF